MQLEVPLVDEKGSELQISMNLCCEVVQMVTDQMSIGFDIEADFSNLQVQLDKNSLVFLMIRKWQPELEDETQFEWHPVFKSEVKPLQQNSKTKIEWNRFLTTTDSLAKSDETPILVTAYRYNKNGEHKELIRWNFNLEDIKNEPTRDMEVENSQHIRKLRDFSVDGKPNKN